MLSFVEQLYSRYGMYFIVAVFAVVIAVFYGNTLQNGFILDDRPTIVENPYVHSLEHLPRVFTGCIWEEELGGCEGRTMHYRPLQTLPWLITWQISSSPWFFHLVNLIYFLSAVSLVFIAVRRFTNEPRLAFLTALFFLVHPVNSEVVNWVSLVADLFLAIFSLLVIYFYLLFRQTGRTRNLFYAVLFFFCAILSKETAVAVLPVIIALIDLLGFEKNFRALFKWERVKAYLWFLIPLISYFLMRNEVIGHLGGIGAGASFFGTLSFTDRLYLFFKLFGEYAKVLIFPYPLIFYRTISTKVDFSGIGFLGGLIALVAYIVAAYTIWKKGKRALFFFLSWAFLSILPMLIFYFAVSENFFAERYIFVSTIGFGFLLAVIILDLEKKISNTEIKKWFVPVMALIIAGLSFAVVHPRNNLWHDTATMLRANLEVNPNAPSIRQYLAKTLYADGDVEGAKKTYEEVIQKNPDWIYISTTYNNLADIYRQEANLEQAREYYEKSIEASGGGNFSAYNNLGAMLVEQGEYLNALTNICKALQLNPQSDVAQNNYGRVAGTIENVPEGQFIFLYQDLMSGGAFSVSSEKKIMFREKKCAYNSCIYEFVPGLPAGEILFPFLITAAAFPQEVVLPQDPQFNPATQSIFLSLDEKYKDRLLTFSFPVCSGTRYEVEVLPEGINR